MKKSHTYIYIVLLMAISPCFLGAQTPCVKQQNTQDSIRYLRAYEYVVANDSLLQGERVRYGGRMFYSNYSSFVSEIMQSDEPEHKNMLMKLASKRSKSEPTKTDFGVWLHLDVDSVPDDSDSYNPLFINEQKDLSQSYEKKIYFSRIYGNDLFAEAGFEHSLGFNGNAYLFLFNDDNSIKKVFRQEISGL